MAAVQLQLYLHGSGADVISRVIEYYSRHLTIIKDKNITLMVQLSFGEMTGRQRASSPVQM